MKHLEWALLAAIALTPAVSAAQTEKVLSAGEINESTLIDALLPEVKPPLTRSFRITPNSGQPAAPAKIPSASMLLTFETNSADLTARTKQILDTLGKALQSDKLAEFKFTIEGHADPRGGELFNLQLSQRRADMVVSYLSQTHRIDLSRLKPVGRGQSQLLNTANPDAPENRRVTVKTVVD